MNTELSMTNYKVWQKQPYWLIGLSIKLTALVIFAALSVITNMAFYIIPQSVVNRSPIISNK